ncbi:hypothetical protein JZ751_018509 [Albula glossodonta]|uniref:Mitoregulin n=1 Tax=Albula glossodonta TaxID=121402 RepID=A0A8T2NZI2_9TELE|nr:hypothetical protein JZ751_018509 [Albula glossodonta]
MADVSERALQVAILISFASGFLAGWQANRMRRRFLDWRKKRLQDKLNNREIQLSRGLLSVSNMKSSKNQQNDWS